MVYRIKLCKRNSNSKKALFLDRDGVININPPKHDYVKNWGEFKFNKKIFSILKTATQNGYKIIVVTNQRGIARKLLSLDTFTIITKNMDMVLKRKGVIVNAVYYCPHDLEEKCRCRKPEPGLFIGAIKDYNIDPRVSIMLGDSISDKNAAKKAGINKIIISKTNLKNFNPDIVKKEFIV